MAELRARSGLAELIEAAVGRKAGQARAQVAAPQVRAQAGPPKGQPGATLEMTDHLAAAAEKILRASWICLAENVYPALIRAAIGGHRLR